MQSIAFICSSSYKLIVLHWDPWNICIFWMTLWLLVSCFLYYYAQLVWIASWKHNYPGCQTLTHHHCHLYPIYNFIKISKGVPCVLKSDPEGWECFASRENTGEGHQGFSENLEHIGLCETSFDVILQYHTLSLLKNNHAENNRNQSRNSDGFFRISLQPDSFFIKTLVNLVFLGIIPVGFNTPQLKSITYQYTTLQFPLNPIQIPLKRSYSSIVSTLKKSVG